MRYLSLTSFASPPFQTAFRHFSLHAFLSLALPRGTRAVSSLLLATALLTSAGCGGGGGSSSSNAPLVNPLLCNTARLTRSLTADAGGTSQSPRISPLGISTQPSGPSGKVLGGVSCDAAQNSVALIRFTSANSDVTQRCSGVLITKQVVLSAAHCFIGLTGIKADVEVAGSIVRARSVVVHPGARFTEADQAIFDDVALLTLPAPLAKGAPLPLLVSSGPGAGDTFTLLGYGQAEGGDFGSLRGGEMIANVVTANHLVAEYDGSLSNSCNGDSGGPALVTARSGNREVPAVVALVSSGITGTKCEKGDISYFALLSSPEVEEFLRARVPRAQYL